MPLGVRVFVAVIFTVLGLSFILTTGSLFYEFADLKVASHNTALTLATFYSHLFIFFPTFGLVALFAFYTPACVFTDMYMRHVPAGSIRFVVGFAVLAAAAYFIAGEMNKSPERSIWEVTPATLIADKKDPKNCSAKNTSACVRLPILDAATNVRTVSQRRIGLSDLARTCKPDPLLGPSKGNTPQERFCLASTPLPTKGKKYSLTTDSQCCKAQAAFKKAMTDLHKPVENRSMTGILHKALLPLKVFFLLVLLVISILLAIRWGSLERHYKDFLSGIERGVLIGAGAMVFYPVMSHAFLHSAGLLYGTGDGATTGFRDIAPFISFFFGAWGLLLLLFFYRLRDKQTENFVRVAGVIGSAVAIVKYELIIDFCVRLFGSGSSDASFILLAIIIVGALIFLARKSSEDMA